MRHGFFPDRKKFVGAYAPPPYASPADMPVVISDIEDVYIFEEIFGIEVTSSIEHANFSAIMKIILF
jgi:hypothetical protein